MVPYLVCFLFSTALIALSEYSFRRNKKIFAIILGGTSVLILSIMAGIRSYDVGTDIDFYILPFYRRAQIYSASFQSLWNANAENVEVLFLILEYISARVFHSPHFVMFALSLLTNGFVYKGIIKQRERMSVSFAWLTYCLIYFNVSLNFMRQSVSVAILFYLFSDLKKLNWKRVIFFTVFAGLFHISGLIGIFFYAVYLMICRRSRIGGLRQVLFLVFMLLPVIIPFAVRIIINLGILSQRFNIYAENQANAAIGNLIFRAICLISYVLLCYRTKLEDKSQYYFLLYAGIMNMLFVTNSSTLFVRLREYFEIFSLTYIPTGLRIYSQKSGTRLLITLIMIVMMTIYWYYIFIFLGNGETYPYSIDPYWSVPLR